MYVFYVFLLSKLVCIMITTLQGFSVQFLCLNLNFHRNILAKHGKAHERLSQKQGKSPPKKHKESSIFPSENDFMAVKVVFRLN